MAKKGIRYAVFAKAVEATDGSITYSEAKNISPVAGFNGSVNKSTGKDYGDDRVVDVENTVIGGTLVVELNNDEDEIYTYLLGHVKDTGASSNAVTFNASDEPPYVGVGAYGQSGNKWVAKWYAKVQFSEPNDDNTTKQESVSFGHVSLEGDILIPADGKWKYRETFTTEAAAKAWVNNKAGLSS